MFLNSGTYVAQQTQQKAQHLKLGPFILAFFVLGISWLSCCVLVATLPAVQHMRGFFKIC